MDFTKDLKATIVITTKNRLADLKRCLKSCENLNGIFEILVFVDGSEDGSYEYVKENYPNFSLYRSEISMGLINARSHCAKLAMNDIIISVDDDCVFQDKNTIVDILKYFKLPKVGVVTIPVIDVNNNNHLTQMPPNLNDYFLCSGFRGCGYAMRKDIFLELGGFATNLVRQEEESDFSMNLYKHGYRIIAGVVNRPILHFHSTSNRNFKLISFYRSRNKLLTKIKYTPLIVLVPILFQQVVHLTFHSFKDNSFKSCFEGFIDVFRMIYRGEIETNRMPIKQFLFYTKLRKLGYEKIRL